MFGHGNITRKYISVNKKIKNFCNTDLVNENEVRRT